MSEKSKLMRFLIDYLVMKRDSESFYATELNNDAFKIRKQVYQKLIEEFSDIEDLMGG